MQSGLKNPSIYCSYPQHSHIRASILTDPVTDVMLSELPLSLPDILRERRGGSSPLGPPFRGPSRTMSCSKIPLCLTKTIGVKLDFMSPHLISRYQVTSYATIHISFSFLVSSWPSTFRYCLPQFLGTPNLCSMTTQTPSLLRKGN